MMLFFGASLTLIGIGMYLRDNVAIGVILMIAGVSMVVIGFSIVRFHVTLGLNKEYRKKK